MTIAHSFRVGVFSLGLVVLTTGQALGYGMEPPFDADHARALILFQNQLQAARTGSTMRVGGIVLAATGLIGAAVSWPVTIPVAVGLGVAALAGGAAWAGSQLESKATAEAALTRKESSLNNLEYPWKDQWFLSLSRAEQQRIVDSLDSRRTRVVVEFVNGHPQVSLQNTGGSNVSREAATSGATVTAPGGGAGGGGVTR